MEYTPLTDGELDRIGKALISRDHKRCFAIARFTGQRFVDIISLKIGDVYGSDLLPLKRATFTRFNGKKTDVLIVPRLEERLIRFRPKNMDLNSWLFPSSVLQGEHIKFSACDKWFRAALVSSGLDIYPISAGDIRKSFIYKLHRGGMGNSDIAAVLGMTSIGQYAQSLNCEPVDICEIMSRILDSA
jgi:integrase